MEKSSSILIADTRERHVLRHEKELESVNLEIKQITTGDYVVVNPAGVILAVIERKSLEDFAASIKDGRCQNIKNLIKLQKSVGCRIIYIIEGPEFPSPTDCFGNIPYRIIESSIFHLMIRDNVSILQTRDSLGTAKLLARFVASMDTLSKKMIEPEPISPAQPVEYNELLALLTHKHEKSQHEIVREMWSRFPGITVESADDYIKHWTIADIVCGKISHVDINNLKMASGKKMNKKAAASLTHIAKNVEINLLSKVPGISPAIAIELINKTPLSRLLTSDVASMSAQTFGKAKRRLGNTCAERVLKLFNYKYVKETTSD